MALGFYFDQTRCNGCYTCVVACKDWHDTPAGPASRRRVFNFERGKFPNTSVAYFSTSCYHCATPLCSVVCPAQAITKREDGVVSVDRGKCREAGRCGIISSYGDDTSYNFGNTESPCQVSCPAHVNIPAYLALIAKGKFKEALSLIRRRMPLPIVCGRVCLAPCETECRRQEVDQPIAINSLKRFVTDYPEDSLPSPLPRLSLDKVAIIGSGPAGLSAAYDLVKIGYGVTIYEALPVAGGMLAVGIPPYRLPKELLKRDIDYIQALGVEIKTNMALGQEINLNDLSGQYSAVLLAIGTHAGQKLKIDGAELNGTLVATSFLRDFNLGKKLDMGDRVLVLGGGNVAMDCARTALRLGANEVDVVCLEKRENMPAEISQIKEGEEEGIHIHTSLVSTSILGEGGRVSGVQCAKVDKLTFDESGRPHYDIVAGTERIMQADTVIFAVGQKADLAKLAENGISCNTGRGNISVDPQTLATSRPGVFAAGDAVQGPTNVVQAIAHGQQAALYIDRYLRGHIVKANPPSEALMASEIRVQIPSDVIKQERPTLSSLPIADRIHSFEEVTVGLSPESAIAEANRCLNCAGHLCRDVCPYGAPQFGYEAYAKMQMCDFCAERLAENKPPICVAACPVYALDSGPLDELAAKYGNTRQAEGFVYSPDTQPSILLKPKKTLTDNLSNRQVGKVVA